MDSHILIDAQFDRAVEIVQGLPKTGPIQTDYEEKLTMYRWETLKITAGRCVHLNTLTIVCISKVLFRTISWSRLSDPYSNCRKCQVTEAWHVGYAWTCKMVILALFGSRIELTQWQGCMG